MAALVMAQVCGHCHHQLDPKDKHCESPTCDWLRCAACRSLNAPRGHIIVGK